MTMPGASGGQGFEQRFQSFGAAGGCADHDHFLSGLSHGARGLRQDHVGGEFGLEHCVRGAACTSRAPAAALTISQMAVRESSRILSCSQARLGDDFDSAVFERTQRALRAFIGEARTDHDRNWVLGHDHLQECEAVHARHLDVEGDDVGNFFGDAIGGDEGIGGSAHDFDLGVGWPAGY